MFHTLWSLSSLLRLSSLLSLSSLRLSKFLVFLILRFSKCFAHAYSLKCIKLFLPNILESLYVKIRKKGLVRRGKVKGHWFLVHKDYINIYALQYFLASLFIYIDLLWALITSTRIAMPPAILKFAKFNSFGFKNQKPSNMSEQYFYAGRFKLFMYILIYLILLYIAICVKNRLNLKNIPFEPWWFKLKPVDF